MRKLILPPILVLILISGVVLGIVVSQTRQGRKGEISTPTANPQIVGVSSYENRECKFAINYPGVWRLVESVGGAQIENPKTGEKINIACQPDIPRRPLPPEKIEDINLDGVTAKLYHDTSPKDGSPIDVVIADVEESDNDLYLSGYGVIFNDILTSFRWII